MQRTTRSEGHRTIVRLAFGAALIAFLLPLLPVYGGGFIFSVGYPWRTLISYFLGAWTNLALVAAGIFFLKQDRLGVAGGFFAAVALTLGMTITGLVVATAPHFVLWPTIVYLTLEMIEGVLLAFAAVRAIRASNS
jgi:hypothetical protein